MELGVVVVVVVATVKVEDFRAVRQFGQLLQIKFKRGLIGPTAGWLAWRESPGGKGQRVVALRSCGCPGAASSELGSVR